MTFDDDDDDDMCCIKENWMLSQVNFFHLVDQGPPNSTILDHFSVLNRPTLMSPKSLGVYGCKLHTGRGIWVFPFKGWWDWGEGEVACFGSL